MKHPPKKKKKKCRCALQCTSNKDTEKCATTHAQKMDSIQRGNFQRGVVPMIDLVWVWVWLLSPSRIEVVIQNKKTD